MPISGAWQNEYESVMTLAEEADGFLHGQYRSGIGSTGTCLVAGYGGTSGPGQGTPLALAISWRSIEPGAPDPRRHWVSSLAGQAFLDCTGLTLLHQLVATAASPEIAEPGTHLGELNFRRIGAASPPASRTLLAAHLGETIRTAAADPVEGVWRSTDDDAATLHLAVRNPHAGIVVGTLTDRRGQASLYGFADVDASRTPARQQSLALAGRYGDSAATATLAGCLDLERGRLTLSALLNRGTSVDTRYAQTIVEGRHFKPA